MIENLGLADKVPADILHLACHARRNEDLEGRLDFSGITNGRDGPLNYKSAAIEICKWCGGATSGKTDLIFFNACHSHTVGTKVLKLMSYLYYLELLNHL